MTQDGTHLPVELELAFKLLSVVGAVLAATGAIIALFLKRYWDGRDEKQRLSMEKEAQRLDQEWRTREAQRATLEAERLAHAGQRASLREALVASLRWFEGGTQSRSIGISVVLASWDDFPDLQGIWLGVLSNQAVYLLTESRQRRKPHEITNLRRIMDVLIRDQKRVGGGLLDSTARLSLRQALDDRLNPEKQVERGVEVDAVELMDWWQALGY